MAHEATLAKPLEAVAVAWPIRALGMFRKARTAPKSGEVFTRAYADNLSHRLPLLYCVVLFDTAVLMASFHSVAPALLVFWLPLPFVAIGCQRAAYWLPHNVKQRSLEDLARGISRLSKVGTAISLVPMCWSLSLYRYGDHSQQSLIHYLTAVTCFTGILSLGQAPRTAIRMAVAVMIPSSIFFLLQDHPNRFGIVAVQIVVTLLLLLLITAGYHDDFVRLELSRQELSRREQESARLAETNRLNASRDALTGANNRRAILALLEQALKYPIAPPPWLALVDLDGFKHINDTYGHAAGDAVLCAVSRLIESVPEIESFGRLGGDEFAILIPGTLDLSAVSKALDGLSQSICQPIELVDLRLSVRASIGLHQCSGKDLGECLERADTALYKAKEHFGGAVARFTELDEHAMRERRDAIRVLARRAGIALSLTGDQPPDRFRADQRATAKLERLQPPVGNHGID